MSNTPQPFILIAEDDKELAPLIADALEQAGMQSQTCHDAEHATRFLRNNFVNLMLLDVNLPDSSGFSLMETLRGENLDVPTIFLTGLNSERDKLRGLEQGGDDYITKPFSFPELIARIHAVLRRAETSRDTHITRNAKVDEEPFEFCGAEVNPKRMEVTFPDNEVESIGRKELGIFRFLNDNAGTVLTRKSLIHSVWGMHADVKSRSLDQYIVKIRDLYKRHNLSMDRFRTIHGVGYIYDAEPGDDAASHDT